MGEGEKMNRVFFVTGTDTQVGKTTATFVLASLLQDRGINVGVMKPVQCGGDDAQFLKKSLDLKDDLETINPCYSRFPLSPHLAFRKERKKIDLKKIFSNYEQLAAKYEVLLIEGAGGLLVPLTEDYFVADLIQELKAEVIIVSRLGLGTINHTLLTIEQLREKGLPLSGILFSQTSKCKGIPEKTNPAEIKKLGEVNILGTIPYCVSLRGAERRRSNLSHIEIASLTSFARNDANINLDSLLKKSIVGGRPQLAAWDKKYVWHPFTQMKDWAEQEPLVIDRAEGNYLIDTNGRKYLDGVSSLWVNVHGHRKKEIDCAIKDQINRLSHSTLLGLANTPSIELAKKLVEIAPNGLEKVFYSDNGSTAVEVAIKMAYQYWQNIGQTKKRKLLHLANSYHGDTLGSVSVGGIDLFHKVYRDLIFETVQIDFPDMYRLPKDKQYPEYAYECVDRFEKMVKRDHAKIACLVVEPLVQGAAGMIVWPSGILKRFSQICRKYHIIFIADEVATGFGRTGKMFACEHENVTPDILCLAKGMTGGYLPLAATLTTKRLFDGFVFPYKDQKTFFHGHTYTGNPLACVAALANIKIFEKECILEKINSKIKYLSNRLKMLYNLPHVGDIRQKGLMVGVELVEDRSTKKPFDWGKRVGIQVCEKVRERGIILRPLGNVIVLMPPLSITNEEIDQIVNAVYWAIEEVINKI